MSGALLPMVLAGHLVGDWIVQTDYQAAHKGRPNDGWYRIHKVGRLTVNGPRRYERGVYWESWRANLAHVASYTAVLVWAGLAAVWLDNGYWGGARTTTRWLILVAVSAVTHSFIDRRWPVRWLNDHTGSKAFGATPFGAVAVDQALHLSILLVGVAWVAR